MKMAIPFILGGIALAAAGTGIKKGVEAKSKNDRARRIARRAKRRFNETKELLESEKEELNIRLQEYGKFKVDVFNSLVSDFLSLVKECAYNVKSEADIRKYLTKEELMELEKITVETLKMSESIAQGVASGAVTAFAVYGTVGTLASASTGTAIASLSGAAATNATLAWLGGGALSAGGLGIAGGTAVLGGLVAGPAIAIAGFMMDSKAEENLTEAREFEADIDVKVEAMKKTIAEYKKIIQDAIDESQSIIKNLIERYKSQKEKLLLEQDAVYNLLYKDYEKKVKSYNNLILRIFTRKPVKPPLCQLGESFGALGYIIKSLKEILQLPLIADLLDVYKENHKVTEEQKTAREAIRAERDINIEKIKAQKEIMLDYFDKIFKERKDHYTKLFELLDKGIENNNMRLIESATSAIVDLAKSTPLKDLEKFNSQNRLGREVKKIDSFVL